jgi:hypothetical protein
MLRHVFILFALLPSLVLAQSEALPGSGAAGDYVDEAGDTMTGPLDISGSRSTGILSLTGGNYSASFLITRNETLGTAPDETVNPYFRIGDIQLGGVDAPMLMVMAGADNLTEKPAFVIEYTGTVASVAGNVRISHVEGFLGLGDVVPVFRLSSAPNMALEMGPGGCVVEAGDLVRATNVTTATCATPHEMEAGDAFLMSHSEANFPAFTSVTKTVVSAPTAYQITYSDTGTNATSTIDHHISGMTDVHWKRTGPNAAAIALGGTNRITFEAGEINIPSDVDLYVNKNGGSHPLLWANYSSNRVGIGATTPGAKLHVEGTAASEKVAIIQAPASNSNHVMDWQNSAGSSLAFVRYDGLIYSGPGFNSSVTQVTQASATGTAIYYNGDHRAGCYKMVLYYTAFTAAALTQDVTIATLPAKTRVTSIIVDTPYNYWGTGAGVYTLRVGHTTGGQEYILDHDVRSGAVTKGLVDGDLGTSINRANAVQGGHIPSWTTTTAITARLTSDVNVSNITAGQTDIYICLEFP